MHSIPYIRLSGFYFFYFALLGALVPYWALYLKELEFSAESIGLLMAILQASRVVAPNVWGWVADRTGRRVQIVRYGAALTCLLFGAIFWQQSLWGIALVSAGFSFFWNAVLPQFEVLTLGHLGEQRERYSQVRLWGSVGFIVTVVGLGWLFDLIAVGWLPHIMLGLMLLIWLNTLLISPPPSRVGRRSSGEGFLQQLLRPQVLAFFAICFLVQFGHGPYYTFYSVLMEGLGYSRGEIGLLWAVGVVAEVLIFLIMPALLSRFGIRTIMLVSLLLCVLRWLMIGLWPEQLGLMLLAQTLHAATFGTLHALGIALVHHYFSDRCHGQGQALFSSAGFGAGGACGALVSGLLWESAGPLATFGLAAAGSLVAIVLATVWIYPEKLQQN
ncbi:MFS transporter [Marinobacterium arenosum]|uniref:MFS transporter n=1 Tax=Marinobacterium arenosum TaxID=2862496 RepID=UPI001C957B10|nr:MFS transporter [Marinobacterium arenosum]MBY4678702.1 MFS transporter [Marinobacterium arenosum]